MKRIRIGNDVRVNWTISRSGLPEDFSDVSVLVQLLDARDRAVPIQSSIAGNIISVLYQGKDQKTVGRYKLVLVENKGEASMATIDHADAFELVPESRMAAGCSCMDVDLFSNIEAGIPGTKGEDAKINGHNAVEIVAGENVEIHQEDDVLTISASGGGSKPYQSLARRDEYLYEITFGRVPDYVPANAAPIGGCTSFVRDGRLYRNLDWKYDETPSFIVRTKDFDGMAFNSAVNDSSMSDTALGQLPYMVVDGVNRHGIMGSVHVLYNDFDWHGDGSIPLTKALYEVLTRVTSMDAIHTALEPVIGELATIPALDAAEYLLQIIITDGTTTYVLTPTSNGYELVDITANPKLANFKWVADAEVERDAVNMQLRPTGVERWNLIGEDTELSDLRFTKCYESADRLSEFVGIDDTTKDSTDAELTTVYNLAHTAYSTRTRNGQLWQTMHSVVYGANGMEHLWCQEIWDKDYVAQSGGGGEQVNSDWEATSGKAEILNKPFYSKPGNKVFEINGETAFLMTSRLENWIYGYHSMVLPWSLDTDVTVTIDGHTVNTKLHSGIVCGEVMMPLIGNLEAARSMLYYILSGIAESMIPFATFPSDVKSLLEEGEPLFMGNLSLSGNPTAFIAVNTAVVDVDSESTITIDINGQTQTVGIEVIEEDEIFGGIALGILDSLILYPEIPACDVYLDGEVRHLKCMPLDFNGDFVSEGPFLTLPESIMEGDFLGCGFSSGYSTTGITLVNVTQTPLDCVHSVSVYNGNVRTAFFENVFDLIERHDDVFFNLILAEAFDKNVYFASGDTLRRYTPEKKTLWERGVGSGETFGYDISTADQKLAIESGYYLPSVSLCAFTDTINRIPIAIYECDEKLLSSHSVEHERQRAINNSFGLIIIENPGDAVLFETTYSIKNLPPVFYCGNFVDIIGTDEDSFDGNPYNGIVFTPVDRDTVIAKRMFGINDECIHMNLGINLMPMTFTTLVDDGRNTPSRIKIVSYKTTPPNIQYCRDLKQYDEVLGDYVVRNNWVDLKFHKNADNQWESEELAILSREVSVDGGNTIVKGDISFRGENPNGLTEIVDGEHKTTRFVIEGECCVYGCPQLLLSADFSILSVPCAGFESLFEDCSGIVGAYFDISCLSADSYAFYRMFKNSGLEFYDGGDVIVRIVSEYCGDFAFAEMFEGSNLIELYSTPLAGQSSAYRMLANCDNLQSFYLSETPCEDSYKEIASGCSSLEEVYLVYDFTDWKDGIGTKDWLKDTPSTGTLYCSEELGTDETIERGADYCPESWTVDNSNNN